MINAKRVAITGATGFLGYELVKRITDLGIGISAIARDEGKLVDLKEHFPNVEIFPCPIEDAYLLKKALVGCDGIFHLASFKDVLLSGQHPTKTIQTNLIGTMNLLNGTIDNTSIKFIIGTSTDKVVKVSSVYGATKFILEALFKEYQTLNGCHCKYRIVRYGNVLYSTGSVLPKWQMALKNNNEIVITDPETTRFFWTKEDAVDFLFECLEKCDDCKPYIPKMKSIEIGKLLALMISKYGSKTDEPKIKYIGIQSSENMHEFLTKDISSYNATRWNSDDLMKLL